MAISGDGGFGGWGHVAKCCKRGGVGSASLEFTKNVVFQETLLLDGRKYISRL